MKPPIPLSQWSKSGFAYPTYHAWVRMLRPENQRQELIDAGVVRFVNNKWLIFPDRWAAYADRIGTKER